MPALTSIASIAVGGLVPFSTVDYPDHLAAVVFCQGCPWRCSYCHNRHLQAATVPGSLAWNEVREWLETRSGLLDAVVFSGGEPLLQSGLAEAMRQVREMGFIIALHTSGAYPQRLSAVLPLIDWIGFDVKAPFDDYARITGSRGGPAAQRALIRMLAAGTPHEIRCTMDGAQWSEATAARMAAQLNALGVEHLVVQACRDVNGIAHPPAQEIIARLEEKIARVELRGT